MSSASYAITAGVQRYQTEPAAGHSGPDGFDLTTPEAIANPYPVYRRMLAEAPVHWNASIAGWVVVRYADVQRAFRDPRLSSNRLGPFVNSLPEDQRAFLEPILRTAAQMTLMKDAPDHKQLRGLTNQAFSPQVVEHLRPRIQQIADDLLDPFMGRGEFDLVTDFADQLPAIVIAELLGVPASDRPQFQAWSDGIIRFFGSPRPTAEQCEAGRNAALAMTEYLEAAIAERRRQPRRDLITHLIRVADEGSRLTEEQIVAQCMLMLVAGQETTASLIPLATRTLLDYPDQLHMLRDDPGLMSSAVEEFLRYESPFQRAHRATLTEIEICGQRIPAGVRVALMSGAANRDPRRFFEPDRFDITRADNQHLAFGSGAHLCQGAPLARLETSVAIQTILRRLPGLRLACDPTRLDWGLEPSPFRALRSLSIAFG